VNQENNSDLEFKRAKESLLNKLKRSLVKVVKSKLQIQEQILLCEQWRAFEHEAVLLQSNFYRYVPGMSFLEVEDWERGGEVIRILLDPLKTASDQIAEKIRKSKKLKRGFQPLEKHLQNLLTQECAIAHQIEQASGIETVEALELYIKAITPPKKPFIPKEERPKSLPYHQFWSASGLKILVGKKAKGNAVVTFKLAKGNDCWFHAAGIPGAHVVLQCIKDKDPDEEALMDALQLALFYSNIKEEKGGEIVATQRKFVQPLGQKELGKVQVSQHKIHFAKRDLKRLEELRKRDGQRTKAK